jgi:hypothetical protein
MNTLQERNADISPTRYPNDNDRHFRMLIATLWTENSKPSDVFNAAFEQFYGKVA